MRLVKTICTHCRFDVACGRPDDRHDTDIVVIGAGIIGITVAAYLAESGRSVTVIDRTGICEETSSGNAAALAFSDVLPLAHKGMMRQLPKWLADPLGPLVDSACLSAEADALARPLLARGQAGPL